MIFAIGELLIDFIAVEPVDLRDVRTFEKHPGGAPANMVVGLRRLGVPAGLISKVGRDP
ncbi:MAG TPA: carbohydrate kinase, partial [Nitrososphaeria archaeon]|nr:carbohydrate kinase [Nitrososphaeria archaeon]